MPAGAGGPSGSPGSSGRSAGGANRHGARPQPPGWATTRIGGRFGYGRGPWSAAFIRATWWWPPGFSAHDVAPVELPGAEAVANGLEAAGFTVHTGPVVSVSKLAVGPRRRELAEQGAVAVDMESAWLLEHHQGPAGRGAGGDRHPRLRASDRGRTGKDLSGAADHSTVDASAGKGGWLTCPYR